jgi:hypothetical protein
VKIAPRFGNATLLRSAAQNVGRNPVPYTAQQMEARRVCKVTGGVSVASIKGDYGPGVSDSSLNQLFRLLFHLASPGMFHERCGAGASNRVVRGSTP